MHCTAGQLSAFRLVRHGVMLIESGGILRSGSNPTPGGDTSIGRHRAWEFFEINDWTEGSLENGPDVVRPLSDGFAEATRRSLHVSAGVLVRGLSGVLRVRANECTNPPSSCPSHSCTHLLGWWRRSLSATTVTAGAMPFAIVLDRHLDRRFEGKSVKAVATHNSWRAHTQWAICGGPARAAQSFRRRSTGR